ncbi:hypothetical protein HDU96_004900 [Phlyctochytrium bullatum]|nr:hypothetical protein HDU96_004900 [Phlyctochytrium bullatum]
MLATDPAPPDTGDASPPTGPGGADAADDHLTPAPAGVRGVPTAGDANTTASSPPGRDESRRQRCGSGEAAPRGTPHGRGEEVGEEETEEEEEEQEDEEGEEEGEGEDQEGRPPKTKAPKSTYTFPSPNLTTQEGIPPMNLFDDKFNVFNPGIASISSTILPTNLFCCRYLKTIEVKTLKALQFGEVLEVPQGRWQPAVEAVFGEVEGCEGGEGAEGGR